MSKLLTISLLLFSFVSFYKIQAQCDSVVTGQFYANDVWYSLKNGTIKSEPRDNWDIAFHILSRSAGIHVNEADVRVNNVPKLCNLYLASQNAADWATLDTAGKLVSANWLHNSDTSWATGAFNKPAVLTDIFDFGWGQYDNITHLVEAKRLFFIQLRNGDVKKLRIDKLDLVQNRWYFTFANLDNTGEKSDSISLSNYADKTMIYYSIENAQIVDRAPKAADWDFIFTRYVAKITVPAETLYVVSGVLQNHQKNLFNNKGVTVAEVTNVDTTTKDFTGKTFATEISTIGSDWKAFDQNFGVWTITPKLVYFVKDQNDDVYKIVFTGFSGSSRGTYNFCHQKVGSLVSADAPQNAVSCAKVYPNPAAGQMNLLFDLNQSVSSASVTISDLNGRVLRQQNLPVAPGFYNNELNINGLSSGLYVVTVTTDGVKTTEKVLITN